jgi:hypothetical protein
MRSPSALSRVARAAAQASSSLICLTLPLLARPAARRVMGMCMMRSALCTAVLMSATTARTSATATTRTPSPCECCMNASVKDL